MGYEKLDVEKTLKDLTTEEKIALTAGRDLVSCVDIDIVRQLLIYSPSSGILFLSLD
jgi:hypothetical protein